MSSTDTPFRAKRTKLIEPSEEIGSATTLLPPKPKRAREVPVEFKPVKVDPKVAKAVPLPPTKRYWVGAFADAPFDNKSFGGTTFQKWTGRVENDPKTGELLLGQANLGNVVDLDEEQVSRITTSIARSVIRISGNRADATGNYRCDRYDVTLPGYRPMGIDKPVAQFLYMVEIGELMPPDWRKQQPPSMLEE